MLLHVPRVPTLAFARLLFTHTETRGSPSRLPARDKHAGRGCGSNIHYMPTVTLAQPGRARDGQRNRRGSCREMFPSLEQAKQNHQYCILYIDARGACFPAFPVDAVARASTPGLVAPMPASSNPIVQPISAELADVQASRPLFLFWAVRWSLPSEDKALDDFQKPLSSCLPKFRPPS
jgi:hypothetical protein